MSISSGNVALVIVSWNSARELPGLLDSIGRHLPAAVEVVVVDNASTDDSAAVAERWAGGANVVRLSENAGFGRANNIGVRAASAPVLLLLNPDSLLLDDSLLRLADLALAQHAICGPEVLHADGSRQPSASATPAGWEVGVTALLPAALLPRSLRIRSEPWRAGVLTAVGWLTGACLAAPRSVLLALGPFDETIHLYGEDLDLGLRARARGVRSLYAPDVARILHFGGTSTAQRFSDSGAAEKLRIRRAVVERHFGPRRERYDFATQIVFHSTRYVAKRVLGRDRSAERNWLRALAASPVSPLAASRGPVARDAREIHPS